jgi:hypothetical protein
MMVGESLNRLRLARNSMEPSGEIGLLGLDLALRAFENDADWQRLMREATASVLIDFMINTLQRNEHELIATGEKWHECMPTRDSRW